MESLRYYQKEAVNAVIDYIKKSTEPCLIEAPMRSGKSFICAAIARKMHEISGGKKVLCMAPSAELVKQNHEKYLLTGNKASIFCASISVSMRHPVVFATPGTAYNRIDSFCEKFCAIILDEAHRLEPRILSIIDSMRNKNNRLRVIGMTGTPYRTGTGYIYKMDEHGNPSSDNTSKAYFHKLVYKIRSETLVKEGFILKPVIAGTKEHYDTINMQLKKNGMFDQSDIDKAYKGQGRKTARIISDIVAHAHDATGVLIYAATVEHAHECMQSLPPELSAIITGTTKKKDRELIIKKFHSKKIKYLVNVNVLSIGFNAPHVTIIAILRPTESAALFAQIACRGATTDTNKTSTILLDYAQNIERHCPDGDIFNPKITQGSEKNELEKVDCTCPGCGTTNTFLSRPNPDGYGLHESGYFSDLTGSPLKIPSHYGRRCQAYHISKAGSLEQCSYRWIGKDCDKCGHENDIAARFCEKCKHELINPNDPLVIDSNLKDMVLSWRVSTGVSKSNKEFTKIMYVLASGKIIPVWYTHHYIGREAMQKLKEATDDLRVPPLEIEYYKNLQTGFYEIINYKKAKNLLTAIK